MRHHRMAGVGLVLDQHLPVAGMHVADRRRLDCELPLRRAVDHVVDGRKALAEIILEGHAVVAQPGEDEIAIDHDVPDLRQSLIRLRVAKAGALVALLQRDREQRAVGLEDQA